jgi:hypothetical protein
VGGTAEDKADEGEERPPRRLPSVPVLGVTGDWAIADAAPRLGDDARWMVTVSAA